MSGFCARFYCCKPCLEEWKRENPEIAAAIAVGDLDEYHRLTRKRDEANGKPE